MLHQTCPSTFPLLFSLPIAAFGSWIRLRQLMALEIPVFSSVMDIEPDTGFFICFLGVLVVHAVTEVVVAEAVAPGGGKK